LKWIPIIQEIKSLNTILFQHHDHNYIRKYIKSNVNENRIHIIGNGNMGMYSRPIVNTNFEKSFETNYGLLVYNNHNNNEIDIKSINEQNTIFDNIKIPL
jgi:hypothetical protein